MPHLFSKLTTISSNITGLFHKAISESGTAFTPDVIGWTRNSAVMVAEYLGIQTDDWGTMLSSLQEVDVAQIREAQSVSYYNNSLPHMYYSVLLGIDARLSLLVQNCSRSDF